MSNKQTNKIKKNPNLRKLKDDGKAIADVQQGIHRLKGRTDAIHQGSSKGGLDTVVQLLGEREASEAAWLMCLGDCEDYAARVPITQVTGAVPVDLYRKTEFGTVTTDSVAGRAFTGTAPDGWYEVTATGAMQMLHANGASSKIADVTGVNYAGTTFPSPAVVLPTGVTNVTLGDVSADFVAGADDGTEYMMVADKFSLRALKTPNGSADEHFVGKVYAFRTLDPERYPIAGQSVDDLRALAYQEDSQIQLGEFLITPEGEFVPAGSPGAPALPEISLMALPLNTGAYERRRIDTARTTVLTHTLPAYEVGFAIESAPATDFEVRYTGVWQTERYPSALIRSGAISAVSSAAASVNQAVSGLMHAGGLQIGHYNPIGRPSRRVDVLASRPVGHLVVKTNNPSQPYSVKKKDKESRLSRPVQTVLAPPRSVQLFATHAVQRMGEPLHGGAPAAAAVSAVLEQPGVWSQLATQGPAALRNVVCDKKVADALVQHGPKALDKLNSTKDWSLKNILGGVWDVAKTVGPAILGALI